MTEELTSHTAYTTVIAYIYYAWLFPGTCADYVG